MGLFPFYFELCSGLLEMNDVERTMRGQNYEY